MSEESKRDSETIPSLLPERLRWWRKQRGAQRDGDPYTQAEVGKHLRVSQATVQGWESGLYPIPAFYAAKLSQWYGVGVQELLGREGIQDYPELRPSRTLGERLMKLRLQESLRRGRLLERTDVAREMGVSYPAYYNWETDHTEPRKHFLEILAFYYNVSTAYLRGKERGKHPWAEPIEAAKDSPGERLRASRVQTGTERGRVLPQREVAQNISVSIQTYRRWERDEGVPTRSQAQQLGRYFQLSPAFWYGSDWDHTLPQTHTHGRTLLPRKPAPGCSMGERIRYLRWGGRFKDSPHWQMEDLARQAGISPSTLGAWERNQAKPRPDALARLARALGVTVHYLQTGRD